ncbi:MAG: GNAT family N-acetyltransferase [Dehalococcoidia bacterium]
MKTGPVSLRPVAASDLQLLERMAVEPELGGLPNWFGFRNAGAVRRRFEADGFLAEDNGLLMVVSDSAVVGQVSWHPVFHGPPASRCWNMGISLLPEWRGRGLGSQAQHILVEYLFATTAVMRVEAETLADNIAEQRALEKAGFTREGVLRAAQFHRGAWRDITLYSHLRGEPIDEIPEDVQV